MNTTPKATPDTASPSASITARPPTAHQPQKAHQNQHPATPPAVSAAQCSSTAGTAQMQNAQPSPPVTDILPDEINQLNALISQAQPIIRQLHRRGLISTATRNSIEDEFELSQATLNGWSTPETA